MEIKPYANEPGSRKEQVRRMFDRIAGKYDFLNHLLSFNIDRKWRKKVQEKIIEDIKSKQKEEIEKFKLLDVATGTGDLAFLMSKIESLEITGLDLSPEMIAVAKKKSILKDEKPEFIVGDSESLPFTDNSFDFITVAFGVRNFENLEKGLGEFLRVLKSEGKVYILEFSRPSRGFFSGIYSFYSRYILTKLASAFGGEAEAYSYLPRSISAFPSGNEMLEKLTSSGFSNATSHPMSKGVATIYEAKKR